MRTLAVVAALATGLSCSAFAADAPKVTTEPVITTDTTVSGQKIEVPQNPKVVAFIATFPPGAALPIHKHPYPHYVYVLEGSLTVFNVDTGKSFVAKQGQFIVETNTNWHYGKNEGAVPVKLLVIDQMPAGTPSNMDVKK